MGCEPPGLEYADRLPHLRFLRSRSYGHSHLPLIAFLTGVDGLGLLVGWGVGVGNGLGLLVGWGVGVGDGLGLLIGWGVGVGDGLG